MQLTSALMDARRQAKQLARQHAAVVASPASFPGLFSADAFPDETDESRESRDGGAGGTGGAGGAGGGRAVHFREDSPGAVAKLHSQREQLAASEREKLALRSQLAAHEARAARTRPPVLFVSITGTFSGSSGERYVPSLPMRPIEPPIPVRRLPSLPRCASGEIDPVSCSRSRRDRVADPARRALRRAAHVTLIWRQDRFPPAKDALRDPLTSSPPRAFPATSRTT